MIDQLIDEDDKFILDKTKLYREYIVNKTKLYCKYILRLNKEYVDSINSDLYEDCKYILRLNKEYVDSINSDLYEDCKNYSKKFSSNEEKIDMRNLRITGI